MAASLFLKNCREDHDVRGQASIPRASSNCFPTPALLAACFRRIYRSLLASHAHSHEFRSRAYIFAFFSTGETAFRLDDVMMKTKLS